jgi:hypothetical protein
MMALVLYVAYQSYMKEIIRPHAFEPERGITCSNASYWVLGYNKAPESYITFSLIHYLIKTSPRILRRCDLPQLFYLNFHQI